MIEFFLLRSTHDELRRGRSPNRRVLAGLSVPGSVLLAYVPTSRNRSSFCRSSRASTRETCGPLPAGSTGASSGACFKRWFRCRHSLGAQPAAPRTPPRLAYSACKLESDRRLFDERGVELQSIANPLRHLRRGHGHSPSCGLFQSLPRRLPLGRLPAVTGRGPNRPFCGWAASLLVSP